MELRAKYTLFAEGCRGHLASSWQARFDLRDGVDRKPTASASKGAVGSPRRPAPNRAWWSAHRRLADGPATCGGGGCCHSRTTLVAVASWLRPESTPTPSSVALGEFQRDKTHPEIRVPGSAVSACLRRPGDRRAYGLQSQPKLVIPGGALTGDDAGFLNAARIQACTPRWSPALPAAEAAFWCPRSRLQPGPTSPATGSLQKASWLHAEAPQDHATSSPAKKKGLWLPGSSLFRRRAEALFGGNVPWTPPQQRRPPPRCGRQPKVQPDQLPQARRQAQSSTAFPGLLWDKCQPTHDAPATYVAEGRLRRRSASTSPLRHDAREQLLPAGVAESCTQRRGR